jgi:hypothetical protein
MRIVRDWNLKEVCCVQIYNQTSNKFRDMKKYILPLFAALALVACEEESKNEPDPQPSTPNAVNPSIPMGVDAVFIAINTASTITAPFIGEQTIYVGTAVATSSDNSDMGSVTCEGEELTNNSNGSYTYTPGLTSTQGLDFDRPINWSVGGGSTIRNFSYDHSVSMPEIGGVAGDTDGEVDLAQGITLSLGANTDLGSADSLYYVIYDKDGEFALKRASRNVRSMTFSNAELSGLSAGFGYIQINAFTYLVAPTSPQGGESVAFVAQGTNTKSVTLK